MRRSSNRNVPRLLFALTCVVSSAQVAVAQAKAGAPIFGLGYTDVGAVIGVGGVGSASASFGSRFEHAIKALPDLGNGMLGIQAAFDYYSWSGGTGLGTYSWKYIPIGVTANYHFKVSEPKLDPFLGLGLGYQYITCDAPGLGSGYCSSSSIYFIGRAGARYFFSPKMAVYGDAGAGGATLNLGVMFKLN